MRKVSFAVLVAFQKYTHRNGGLKKLPLVKQVFSLTQKKKLQTKIEEEVKEGGNNKCGIDVQDGEQKRLHKFNASQKQPNAFLPNALLNTTTKKKSVCSSLSVTWDHFLKTSALYICIYIYI